MKNQIEQDIEHLKKEIVVDDVEALLLTAGGDYSPMGIECPYCNRDIDLDEIFKKVKNRAKLQQAERDKKFFDEFVEKFNSDLFIYISECLREVDGININWRVLKKYAEDKLDNLAGEIKK